MKLDWVFLPEPVRPEYTCIDEGEYSERMPTGRTWIRHPVWAYTPEVPCPAALLLEDGSIAVYGHWTSWSTDEGCGCCAGSRDEKILAWAPLNIEAPPKP